MRFRWTSVGIGGLLASDVCGFNVVSPVSFFGLAGTASLLVVGFWSNHCGSQSQERISISRCSSESQRNWRSRCSSLL